MRGSVVWVPIVAVSMTSGGVGVGSGGVPGVGGVTGEGGGGTGAEACGAGTVDDPQPMSVISGML